MEGEVSGWPVLQLFGWSVCGIAFAACKLWAVRSAGVPCAGAL